MKLGIDSPLRLRQIMGSTDWGLYIRNGFTLISTHKSQYQAWVASQELLNRVARVQEFI